MSLCLKKNCCQILESIDIFSFPISFLFNFDGKGRFSTLATKLTTLLTILLCCLSFIYFGRNYIYKSNPTTLLREEYNYDPDEVFMTPNLFFFSFAIESLTRNNYQGYI